MTLLQGLPKDFSPSVLLVQHMTPGFTAGLVEWLNAGSPLPVRLATAGTRLPWQRGAGRARRPSPHHPA